VLGDLDAEERLDEGAVAVEEDLHVLAARVQHLDGPLVGEDALERSELAQGDGIDEGDRVAVGDLDQPQAGVEGALAHELGVDAEDVGAPPARAGVGKGVWGVDVNGLSRRRRAGRGRIDCGQRGHRALPDPDPIARSRLSADAFEVAHNRAGALLRPFQGLFEASRRRHGALQGLFDAPRRRRGRPQGLFKAIGT
jgi:hypothetical protein